MKSNAKNCFCFSLSLGVCVCYCWRCRWVCCCLFFVSSFVCNLNGPVCSLRILSFYSTFGPFFSICVLSIQKCSLSRINYVSYFVQCLFHINSFHRFHETDTESFSRNTVLRERKLIEILFISNEK